MYSAGLNVGIHGIHSDGSISTAGNFTASLINGTLLEIVQTGTFLAANITNTGTGDSFRVNDAASDTTPFVINGSGFVGIGTTSPLAKLEVDTGTSDIYIGQEVCVGAFTGIQIGGTPSSACLEYTLLSDATDIYLNAHSGGTIFFRDGNSGTTALGNNMIIDSNGNVGIADDSPDDKLDVVGDLDVSSGCIQVDDGSAHHGTCASDARLKENIQYFEEGSLDLVSQLKPASFEWREDMFEISGSEGNSTGLIVQDFERVFPHLVVEKDGFKYIILDGELDMHLIQAIKELKSKNYLLTELICLDHPDSELCGDHKQQ